MYEKDTARFRIWNMHVKEQDPQKIILNRTWFEPNFSVPSESPVLFRLEREREGKRIRIHCFSTKLGWCLFVVPAFGYPIIVWLMTSIWHLMITGLVYTNTLMHVTLLKLVSTSNQLHSAISSELTLLYSDEWNHMQNVTVNNKLICMCFHSEGHVNCVLQTMSRNKWLHADEYTACCIKCCYIVLLFFYTDDAMITTIISPGYTQEVLSSQTANIS
jgi:hypothetical protein